MERMVGLLVCLFVSCFFFRIFFLFVSSFVRLLTLRASLPGGNIGRVTRVSVVSICLNISTLCH